MNSYNHDEKQRRQEEQYDFPYHYIPDVSDGSFTQTKHWSWGYRYLGGIRIVLDRLATISFESLIDIGCGDGRFLRELLDYHPETEAIGIDYSRRAVDLANAMNPTITYRCHDLVEQGPVGKYDVATLIEVLEHVPPDELDDFLKATAESISSNGSLVLTVPHSNKTVNPKHYQHFAREDLRTLLDSRFTDFEYVPFDDTSSTFLRMVELALGRGGSHFLVTNDRVLSAFWNLYKRRYLYTNEERCGRIAIVCRKQ